MSRFTGDFEWNHVNSGVRQSSLSRLQEHTLMGTRAPALRELKGKV
jgi:hypothetical protein